MAYSAALNTVYNHYLASYAPKSTTRYDTHKRGELKSIYNSIVKLSKESPLYLIDTSRASQGFAVDLKENARQLRNTIASLGGLDEDEMLNKKSAYSSNSNLAEAVFVGRLSDDDVPSFNIEVTSLASGQTNVGRYLPSSLPIALRKGSYAFDVIVNDLSYEFQYNIREGETNRDIQQRLSRLINNSDIGLRSDVLEDGSGNSALRLTSATTGLKGNREVLFHVSDNNGSDRLKGSVSYLGLDSIAVEPSNAQFLLNGEPKSAPSNHFTIDNLFEVHLNGVSTSSEDTAEIGLMADVDSLAENINNLIAGYNSFISSVSRYVEAYPLSGRLIKEMNHMSLFYQENFEKIGISYGEQGTLSLDKDVLRQSTLAEKSRDGLDSIKGFTNSILQKTRQVSLDPMQYVKRTLVAYKNPGHSYAAPYETSTYSGMMFNSYC
jgi:flagellar hook-associated protein 2